MSLCVCALRFGARLRCRVARADGAAWSAGRGHGPERVDPQDEASQAQGSPVWIQQTMPQALVMVPGGAASLRELAEPSAEEDHAESAGSAPRLVFAALHLRRLRRLRKRLRRRRATPASFGTARPWLGDPGSAKGHRVEAIPRHDEVFRFERLPGRGCHRERSVGLPPRQRCSLSLSLLDGRANGLGKALLRPPAGAEPLAPPHRGTTS